MFKLQIINIINDCDRIVCFNDIFDIGDNKDSFYTANFNVFKQDPKLYNYFFSNTELRKIKLGKLF